MLDSYYEIEQNGQKYFGNVSLKEFHRFQQDGENYLFNVATMTPYKISEAVARLVDKAAFSFGGGLLPEQSMEALKKLKLIAEIAPHPAPSAPESATDEVKTTHETLENLYAVANIALFVAQECNMACVYC